MQLSVAARSSGASTSSAATAVVEPGAWLDREQALLSARAPGSRLVLWVASPALTVCRSETRLPFFSAASDALAREGWPVVLRRSGGAAFPLGPGVLNLSLLRDAPPEPSVDEGYRWFCGLLAAGLQRVGVDVAAASTPGSFCDGRFNLVCDGRKVAGTAQQWRRLPDGAVRQLFHCALLVDVDVAALAAVVNRFYGAAEGPHGGTRVDPDTLASLGAFAPGLGTGAVSEGLRAAFCAEPGVVVTSCAEAPQAQPQPEG